MLDQCWANVGQMLAKCWPNVDKGWALTQYLNVQGNPTNNPELKKYSWQNMTILIKDFDK